MREAHLKLSPRQMSILVCAMQVADELKDATEQEAERTRDSSLLMSLPTIEMMANMHAVFARRLIKGRWEQKTEYGLTLKPIRAAVVISALGNSILNADDELDVLWKDSAQRLINEINAQLWM
jgi:hypothetical protein